MAPIFRIYHPGKRKFNPTKQTVKFLSFCRDSQIHKDILSRAPPKAIKGICNAALNCRSGDFKLSTNQKRVLRKHRHLIETLVNKKIPLERKRRVLIQRGGGLAAAIIPVILSTVLGALGTNLFKK